MCNNNLEACTPEMVSAVCQQIRYFTVLVLHFVEDGSQWSSSALTKSVGYGRTRTDGKGDLTWLLFLNDEFCIYNKKCLKKMCVAFCVCITS